MVDIIPPRDENTKSKIMTAEDMFQVWNWKRSDELGICEFAEAYAAYRDEESAKLIEEDGELLRRAAELLRHIRNEDNVLSIEWAEWQPKVDDWLRDAGMEEK